MPKNKLNIKYIKKNNSYIILDNLGRIIWCFNYFDLIDKLNLDKSLEFKNQINTTKQVKKYNFFLKNINIFGLYPIYNLNEFN